jgi:tetratricopeptide (TPR) repeat protein
MDPETFPALLGRARANRLKAMAAGVSPERKKELLGLAGKDIEKVRKKDPKSREAVLESARLHKDRGETAEARDDLKNVIDALEEEMKKEAPTFKRENKQLLAEAYGERGNINIDLGDKNQAQADFEAALKVDPNFALAYNRMGLVAEKMNQFDEAKRKYQKAIEMQPGNPDFELGLGILYQEYLKDYQKALEHYEAFRDKGGMDPRLPAWIQECKNALKKK